MVNKKRKGSAKQKPEAHANITAHPGTIWVDGHGVLNVGCPDVTRQLNLIMAQKKAFSIRLVDPGKLPKIGGVMKPYSKCPKPLPPNPFCFGCELKKGLSVDDFHQEDVDLDGFVDPDGLHDSERAPR